MPGNADDGLGAQRYKSIGHHTTWFDTMEGAKAYIVENRGKGIIATGLVWNWDGVDVPAMVQWFNIKELLSEAADAPVS